MTLFIVFAVAWVLFIGALVADELGRAHERDLTGVDLVTGWEVIHL